MEWFLTNALTLIPMLALGGWTIYVYQQTRNDKSKERAEIQTTDLAKAHLTEGHSLRQDLREMLNEANERIDRHEEQINAQNEKISELRQTISDLSYEKKILEREKEMLEQDILRREELFQKENLKLLDRVRELEKQVEQLRRNIT